MPILPLQHPNPSPNSVEVGLVFPGLWRIRGAVGEQATMNKRRLTRAVLVLGTVGLLLTVAFGFWVRSFRRQETLNRQLIAALLNKDTHKALQIVNDGADPNTLGSLRPPSLRRLWQELRHEPREFSDNPSAFLLACGDPWIDGDSSLIQDSPDAPELVKTMLQNGANANARDERGWTALIWAVWFNHQKTVPQLLAYGADPNLPATDGITPLQMAQQSNHPDLVTLLKQAGAKK